MTIHNRVLGSKRRELSTIDSDTGARNHLEFTEKNRVEIFLDQWLLKYILIV
jgi:hypothetical protein